MEHVDIAREILNQVSTMTYEAYGRYYTVNCPWRGNEMMSYNEWLEQEGKHYKFLVESMQRHLTELLYRSNIPPITISVEQWNSLKESRGE